MKRWLLLGSLVLATAMPLLRGAVYQATGIKIGEVTADSAIVWTRLTSVKEPHRDGLKFVEMKRREAEAREPSAQMPAGATLAEMERAVPGARGALRVVWTPAGGKDSQATPWTDVNPAADFTTQFKLSGLQAGTTYQLRVESRDATGEAGEVLEGGFRTPPAEDQASGVRFIITTCHDDWRRDDREDGFKMYRAAAKWAPEFFVHTGDFVYLDKPMPFALTPEFARFKWNRTSAWPSVREFYRNTSAYFIKDDHDISHNDSAPGDQFGALSFQKGVDIVDEQLPIPDAPSYRSVRWGQHLEVWLLESREYRNARKREAVSERTLLGEEQKKWLFESLKKSTATFRLVISGTPIVGPNVDYKGGDSGDSLADEVFHSEGEEVRRVLASLPNTFVVAGDRHWQYHSVDPKTGLNEFACGPACFGMAQEFVDKVKRSAMHRFLRIDGGFFSGEIARASDGAMRLVVRHHDVNGSIVYEHAFDAALARASAR
jgi:alkaline phosphatase D